MYLQYFDSYGKITYMVYLLIGGLMKKLKKFLSEACSYATLMLLIVFVFAEFFNSSANGIYFPTFAAVFAYSLVITIANLIKRVLSANIFIKTSIHYLLTVSGFIFLFSFLGNMENAAPTKIFVAIVLFSLLYALVTVVAWIFRKYVLKQRAEKSPTREEKTPAGYTSLYGDNK